MQSNFDLLRAKAQAVDAVMNTQISCTRTRAVLLEIKKLCDQLRKDCLEHAKATKKPKKAKVEKPWDHGEIDQSPEPASEPEPVSEPESLIEHDAAFTLVKMKRTRAARKSK